MIHFILNSALDHLEWDPCPDIVKFFYYDAKSREMIIYTRHERITKKSMELTKMILSLGPGLAVMFYALMSHWSDRLPSVRSLSGKHLLLYMAVSVLVGGIPAVTVMSFLKRHDREAEAHGHRLRIRDMPPSWAGSVTRIFLSYTAAFLFMEVVALTVVIACPLGSGNGTPAVLLYCEPLFIFMLLIVNYFKPFRRILPYISMMKEARTAKNDHNNAIIIGEPEEQIFRELTGKTDRDDAEL